jgi:hypothetical protein
VVVNAVRMLTPLDIHDLNKSGIRFRLSANVDDEFHVLFISIK